MDSSELTAAQAREVTTSPLTHDSSSSHSPCDESENMSPFSTRPQSSAASDHGQPQSVNGITPIVSNASSARRNYNATDGLRNRESGSGSGNCHAKSSTQPNAGDSDNQNPQSGSKGPHGSWYSRFAEKYGSLELDNKGSVARDHLALERTFLAWLRTSLAFASIGIAITQLFRLNSSDTTTRNTKQLSSQAFPPLLSPPFYDPASIRITSTSQRLRSIGKPLGTTFIGVAILILLVGFHRYFESQYWIIRGKFPASRGSVALVALVAAALIVAALAVILAVSPGAVET